MIERKQLVPRVDIAAEIDVAEPVTHLRQRRRMETRLDQNGAERIDVTPDGDSAQQGGLDHTGATSHEGVIHDLPQVGQPLDEEARQLGLEAGSIRHFVQGMRGPLLRRPELVDEHRNLEDRVRKVQHTRRLAELVEFFDCSSKLVGRERAGSRRVLRKQIGLVMAHVVAIFQKDLGFACGSPTQGCPSADATGSTL